jgi:hypothetical protein
MRDVFDLYRAVGERVPAWLKRRGHLTCRKVGLPARAERTASLLGRRADRL